MAATTREIQNEDDFQYRVGKLARNRYGLLYYHVHDSTRDERGFPDCVFVGRTVLFRELKMTRSSRVRPDQKVWLQRLADAGADAAIWYAEDYHSGLVDEQLAACELRDRQARTARLGPPLAARIAKRLYICDEGGNPGRAALLWEAGVESVGHERFIARAQQILALVADELPAGSAENGAWLTERQLPPDSGARVLDAIRTELLQPASLPA